MIFFEIKAATERGWSAFPLLGWVDSDPFIEWSKGISAASNFEEAEKVPMTFVPLWGAARKSQSLDKKADWPNSHYLGPVCSEKFWNVVKADAGSAGWLKFPNFNTGEKSDWGFIFNLPVVDIQSNWQDTTSHGFFASEAQEIDQRFFVSEKLRKLLEGANLTGIVFKKMPIK